MDLLFTIFRKILFLEESQNEPVNPIFGTSSLESKDTEEYSDFSCGGPSLGVDFHSDLDDLHEVIKSARYEGENLSQVDIIKMREPKPLETPAAYNQIMPEKFTSLIDRHLNLLEQFQGEDSSILPGQPVYQPAKFGRADGVNFKLQSYDIPLLVYKCIERNNIMPLKLDIPLDCDNYVKRFQTLLWMEEAHQQIEMRRYDLRGILLARQEEDYFLLPVPTLAEGRPSLMRGDKVVLQSRERNTTYEGYIFEVRKSDVKIKLHERLHSEQMDGLGFDISFLVSRTPFRRAHNGVHQIRRDSVLKKLVFPTNHDENVDEQPIIDIDENPENLRCFMRELNIHQKRAVINMVRNIGRPAPYIVFGPPGTGKTVTLVEAILQVYARRKTCKILVCANSNAATDLLARRIKGSNIVDKNHIIRVSAFYRVDQDLIPEDLKDITAEMDMIDRSKYRSCRIVVTTCIQSGILNDFGDRFDYVFIDEAGHANEPETMIPIGLMKSIENPMEPVGCILAGDPHQLGPICVSDAAKDHGLGLSMLERLFKLSIYQPKSSNENMYYDERFITKLLISYRCDKRVMTVNTKLFYDNELQFVIETPDRYLELIQVNSPLVFHPVKGRDRREFTNPSWFNAEEAMRVLVYVFKLYRSGLKPEQLGIITPYRQQIEKLKLLFEKSNLIPCKIATMEEFQGDEREVIIISTVRACRGNIDYDQKFKLGFLFDQKRFNVAVSRAKWLVIVVGDPDILAQDPCWVEYMGAANRIENPQPAA